MGIRERFIAEVLESSGSELLSRQGAAISSATAPHSGRLLSGRSVRVTTSEGGGVLTLTHPVYERFLDVKAGHRKRRRIHNRFVFGTYSAVARKLLSGYSEQAAQMVRTAAK